MAISTDRRTLLIGLGTVICLPGQYALADHSVSPTVQKALEKYLNRETNVQRININGLGFAVDGTYQLDETTGRFVMVYPRNLEVFASLDDVARQ